MAAERAIPAMDISSITETLYIAAWPKDEDAAELERMNVQLIVNMIPARVAPALRRPPFRALTLPSLDNPFLRIRTSQLMRGVQAALPILADGKGVVCYCREGRHRSVAMACAILIAQGMSADAAMQLVKQRRAKADPDIWYIQGVIRKFERAWQKHRGWGA
jgi:protein tyrosine phosphatase (PTP) superfamily phosphohydrolase (DUF442 family)